MDNLGENNVISIGENVTVTGRVNGNNNTIEIKGAKHPSSLKIDINGNGNKIIIGESFAIKGLVVRCGNHILAHKTKLIIGDNFSIEPNSTFLLYNSGNSIEILDNCMFSNNIMIRCAESPHLVFDKITGAYLDQSTGVFIGKHVWVGERVYITKNVTVSDESLVAACSVVTKRFLEPHAVIAGNPAKIVKQNIQWIRNRGYLEPDTNYYKSYYEFHKQFEE